MPALASRVRRGLKTGKAKIHQNDLGVFAVQLVEEPSGYNLQQATRLIRSWKRFHWNSYTNK